MESDLIEEAVQLNTRKEYVAWKQRCDELIEFIEEQNRTKRPRLAVGHRQSVVARIARLESLTGSVRGRFVHVGAGYGLRWREIETTFESLIVTGAVINSNHIELRRFLEDAGDVVLERVRDAVERHGSVKVNTAFNGDFVTKDKRANKSINTKNSEIYRCTDMREWYERYVIEPYNKKSKYIIRKKKIYIYKHYVKIKNKIIYNNMERVPFVVYADLECVLRKTEPNKEDASSYEYQRHEVFSIGYYVRCSNDNSLSSYHFQCDENCISWFAEELKNLAHRVKDIISANVSMEALSKQQWEAYRTATRCHICEKPFASNDTRVRDHCHLTGRYRGPVHTNCNLNYKNSYTIPVVFHNLSGYDAHFIIKIRHGLRVTKIHRVLQFAQSPWLRDYIELNTQFRTVAKNDFEKNLYKLMKNAVFGKTMENVRNHVDVKLVTKMYRDKCQIMYTDTDSLIYRIECENIYETMKRDIARFDTSDYPADNAYSVSLANKKVPGLMKDENNGMIMTEFVGLRAKMYALKVDGKKGTKKAKGVKNNVVARMITFDDYTRCLNEEIEMTRRQSCIRSKLHEIYTISETKIVLSPYDDSKYTVAVLTPVL
ncbi:hypothetical protein ALC57_04090 [Trachymyrmex cornetzi]|uniref:DNA-directed DNA polymerase n=1 Tax=Trachymyrmex cornetzi TaxID=471704 RepID=A0A151JCK8_9HYME|nr:hypothetical protein ALC57_04090 [Trachymyrmex cornetzi]